MRVPSAPYRAPTPPEPQPAPAPSEQLGLLRSVHAPDTSARRILVFFGLVLVGCIAGSASAPSVTFALALAGCVSVVAGVILLATLLPLRGLRIELHAAGLVVHKRGAREVILFEDVDEVWYELAEVGGHLAQIHALRLVDHAGARHVVPARVRDAATMINWVFRCCSTPLLPDARRALQRGESLTFGNVQIDQDSIRVNGARMAWKDVHLVRMQPGKIALFRRQAVFPWRTIRLDSVPHPAIFSRLVTDCARRIENDVPWFMAS